MAVRVGAHSRLRFMHFVQDSGFEFWDVPEFPVLEQQPDDQTYSVLRGDRLDRLAFQFYGDSVFKWVIAQANEFDDETVDLNEGDVLRIPSPRYVLQVLFARPRR